MPLLTKTNDQFLSDIITTWASLLSLSPNLQSGDPLLAIFQSHVLCGLLFVQSQAVAVNNLTRAATSAGADLDSFCADFGFPRIPALQASGLVQFSLRAVSPVNISIPAGTIIQTTDATIKYQIIADTNQSAWNAALNAYVLTAGSLFVNCTAQAVLAGSASNVQVGALAQFASSVAGVNFVTNLAAMTNGADPESDAAFRNRFKLFINSVNARTTPTGILSAALNTPGVVAVSLVENQDINGVTRPGYGLIIIDDGSGSPPSSLVAAVSTAVSLTNSPARGFTIQNLVVGATLLSATVTLNVKINPLATSPSAVLLNVKLAVINYINSLTIGQPLYLENISFIARGADPNVTGVQVGSITINGSALDLIATNVNVIRTTTLLTTVGTW